MTLTEGQMYAFAILTQVVGWVTAFALWAELTRKVDEEKQVDLVPIVEVDPFAVVTWSEWE